MEMLPCVKYIILIKVVSKTKGCRIPDPGSLRI